MCRAGEREEDYSNQVMEKNAHSYADTLSETPPEHQSCLTPFGSMQPQGQAPCP
jgi:hypothetical protein